MSAIGFIGLGAMGAKMAGRLLGAGHRVYGTNRTRANAESLISDGLVWCATPRQVAEQAEVTFSMVTDDGALEAISFGPDGLLAGLAPGKVYVDMSTVSTVASGRVAERVRDAGARMLAAPVSGSVPAAAEGSLSVIVSGDADAFPAVEPLLRVLGRSGRYVGTGQQALLLKLAINISIGVQMLAFSEGVLLAERGGIDRRLAVEVLTDSAIASPMLKARGPLVLDLPEEAWFDLALMQKDMRLALAAGQRHGVPLPTSAVTDDLLTQARMMGYEQRDLAALFQALAQLPVSAPGSG
ncbi:MAG: NAD(P)-dependent oxidoreductase [Frankiaceae bacterium]